jgi:hypothetical protein
MTKDEALKLALEALERISDRFDLESVAQDATKAITAIKEALAQPEPDDLTIAYMSGFHDGKKKRTWVGLTDEEVIEISHLALTRVQAVQMTEAKLREKNT